MQRIDTVIFDLDGTLIDSSEGIVNSVMETLDILGLDSLSREFVKSCIGPPIADSIGSKVGYTKKQIEDFYKVFRPLYKDKHLMECEIIPGIVDMLKDLKTHGYHMAIATNKREDYTKTLLEKIGLYGYFETVAAMDMEGRLKKPELIGKAMTEMHSSPDHTVMVGDADNDLKGAVANGVRFIGVGYGFGFKESSDVPEPYCFAETPEDVGKIILNG